jgi:hypothetical protein
MKTEATPAPDRLNPEWTRGEFARTATFDTLPSKLRERLSRHMREPRSLQRAKSVTKWQNKPMSR